MTLLLALKSIGLGLTVAVLATVVDQVVENGIAPRLMGHVTGTRTLSAAKDKWGIEGALGVAIPH